MRQILHLLIAACVLLASGCGTAPQGAQPAGDAGGHNETDVLFLQLMVPHLEQGIAIAQLAEGKPAREDIKLLAAAIESTQATEAETMKGWLQAWGAPPTATDEEYVLHGSPGTSKEEIAKLAKATGDEFERQFLNLLIAHQDDAVQLALKEKSGGVNEQARQLADRIDQSRSAQIKMMLGYLGQTAG